MGASLSQNVYCSSFVYIPSSNTAESHRSFAITFFFFFFASQCGCITLYILNSGQIIPHPP